MADEEKPFFDDDEEEDSSEGKKGDSSGILQKVLKYIIIAAVVIGVILLQWAIAEIVHFVNFGDIIKEEKAKYQASLPKISISLGTNRFALMTPKAYVHFDDIILAIKKEDEMIKDDLGFQKARIMHIMQKVISSKTFDELKTDEQRRGKLKTELINKLNTELVSIKKDLIVDIFMPGVRVFKAPN